MHGLGFCLEVGLLGHQTRHCIWILGLRGVGVSFQATGFFPLLTVATTSPFFLAYYSYVPSSICMLGLNPFDFSIFPCTETPWTDSQNPTKWTPAS